ncbi:ABC transporter permease subunit [Reichenbachiella ulvae]|uniref:ABC transporter permease subunit n=1 Tax=Reichenbachiella ulvae TaxID=2980104 RepID=A0ABT3CS15_9BACT|nr:ABC transporter permease subunit [Reichenbachiella ulvae]MCV9386472.1 ABC transporter permease subunit [Reichenbachiella ulvae]
MNKIWIITRRELSSFFDSLIAYVLIVIFLGLSGFFTWLFGNNVFVIGQASLQVFFQIGFWTLFFFIPALTMKMLAEETKSGTIELLSTKAVTDWQIVTGKFLACLLLVMIALVATLPYYVTVSRLGSVDHGAIIGGYLGLVFLSAGYISIGIFASSITNNQIVAFLIALLIGIFFQLLFDMLGFQFRGGLGSVFNYLSMRTHFDSLSRGVIDSRDLVYFASVILGGLTVSQAMLSKRNWYS